MHRPLRKIIPIALTLIVLIGGFLVYNHFQPKVGVPTVGQDSDRGPSDAGMPAQNPKSTFGPGTSPWVDQFDKTTGRKVYRFKSDNYDNRPDGSVLVKNPVIELFQGNGQIVHIEGKDGVIHVAPGSDKSVMNGAPVDPPHDGILNDVIVKVYPSELEMNALKPQMVITMPNARFDNATYRLFTQDYIDPSTGELIKADQVPVQARGTDYDFDGLGLNMFWNDPDKHIKSLDIAHGKQLTMHNASTLSLTGPTTAPAPAKTPVEPSQHVDSPAAVASPSQNKPEAPVIAPPVSPAPSSPRYTATFNDDVKVSQLGNTLTGATMYVDFISKGSDTPATPPPAAAAPTPAPGIPAPAPATPAPVPVAPSPSPAAITAPPAAQPHDVIITWTGKLHIVPNEDPNAEPLDAGQSIIHLVGAPVKIHQPPTTAQPAGTDATCVDLKYHSADAKVDMNQGVAIAARGPGIPVDIIQKRPDGSGATIRSRSVEFSRKNNIAVLDGPGIGEFPDPNDPKSILDAAWEKSCTVNLLPSPSGQLEIQRCYLEGSVKVNHPQFDLASEELELLFDPVKKTPAKPTATSTEMMSGTELREMLATRNAVCNIHDDQGNPRSIKSQQLQLFTAVDPQGQRYAKTIWADGWVTAAQDAQTLDCEHLKMDLLPAPPKTAVPATGAVAGNDVQLQRLEATQSVHVQGKDGASATGDKLLVEIVDGHQQFTISGTPFATVTNADSTTTGPIIHDVPDDQITTIDGPGTLVADQQPADPTQKPQKIHVEWSKSVKVLAKENIIHVLGDVHVKTKSPDGTTGQTNSQAVDLVLEDKPATQPSDHPAPTTQSALAGDQMNFMQNKEVKTIEWTDPVNATIETRLMDLDKLLKRSAIVAKKIDYDVNAHRLTVPMAGGLITENHLPPTTQPGDNNTGRGSTAFQWQKQFVYDETAKQATIDGNVKIIHTDDGPNPKRITIDGNRVVADLEPAPATNPKSPPPTAAGASPQMQIKLVTITGDVKVDTGDLIIQCGKITYNPITQLLDCTAAEGQQVKVFDDAHRGGAAYDYCQVDLKTNTLKQATGVSGHTGG